jgi:hypothetical protein
MTKRFFKIVAQRNYDLVISGIVEDEIKATKTPKRDKILYFLDSLDVTVILYSAESNNLAWCYVSEGVLTDNHIDDLKHMAYATIHECGIIVSWNRTHIANPIKMQKLNLCNVFYSYRPIVICTPQDFIDFLFKGK